MEKNNGHLKRLLDQVKGLKPCLCVLLALLCVFNIAVPGVSAQTAYGYSYQPVGLSALTFQNYQLDGTTLRINKETGDLIGIDFVGHQDLSAPQSMNFDAAYVDFAYDGGDGGWSDWGAYMRNTLFFHNLDFIEGRDGWGYYNTYALPWDLHYNTEEEYPRRNPENVTITDNPGSITVSYQMQPYDDAEVWFKVETTYTVEDGYVVMDSVLTNINDEAVIINGAATVVSGLQLEASAMFEFPANLPAKVYLASGLPPEESILGEYSSPLIHFFNGDTDINLIFANEYEKWVPSVVKSTEGKLDVINLSCTIDELEPGETLYLGKQFFQLADSDKAYAAAQHLYSDNGWEAPTDGVKGSPVYSGHPAGVSDNNFEDAAGTLEAYIDELARIQALGFDSLWMLPVFEHPDSGGSVYLPYNMEHIDPRYSEAAAGETDLDAKRAASYQSMVELGQAAYGMGMNLMLDYVPHGPYMYTPDEPAEKIPENEYDNPWMTPERYEWATVDRWWRDPNPEYTHWRKEWNCFAFDFANQDYLDYMYELVKEQATDFSMTGTRIDAVMGSLPNWNPYGDNRVSQTGLYGGAEMTKAIRRGIADAGHTPLVLPENNNPTPYFAEATDLFYDMPFYRVTLDSRKEGMSEVDFAATVAHWLKTEKMSSPKGMQYGRFLENHDTVAPWYDNYDMMRAVDVYGVEKAQALWVLLSTVDGAPIIYQNDENGNEEFWTDLLAMRRAQFGAENAMDIQYYNNAESGIVAYRRYDDDDQKLVLVNLTDGTESRDFSDIDIGGVLFSTASPDVVYGNASIIGDTISLAAYGYAVIELTGGDAFHSTSDAPEFLVTDLGGVSQNDRYLQMSEEYESFSVPNPSFEPAGLEESKAVFDPVEQYSDETPDGPYWKYMFYHEETDLLDFCETAEGQALGVWRVGSKSGRDYDWSGVGRSTNLYPENHYFEINTDPGAETYGMLVFVAPKSGLYTIPSFNIQGVGSAKTAILVVLQNGEQVAKSGMITRQDGSIRMEEIALELEAGDTLMFYTVRMDGEYSYFQLDSMVIEYDEHGSIDQGGGNGGGGGGSYRGSSSGGGTDKRDGDITRSAAQLPTGKSLTTQTAVSTLEKRLTSLTGKELTLVFTNYTKADLTALQALAKAANDKDVALTLSFTQTANSVINSRIRFNPADATKDVLLTLNPTKGDKVKAFFAKHFANTTSVIAFDQDGSFGTVVDVAVKLDGKIPAENLKLYRYDRTTNSYKLIDSSAYRVDANDYLHFTTETADYFVLSDGPLVRK